MKNATPSNGPSPTAALPHGERRGAARQASGVLGTCRIVDAPEDQLWACEIQDISFSGLGLVLRRWFGPGTALVVQPFGGAAEAPAVVARVLRARPQGGGFWHHGCRFPGPLNEDELRALLPAPPPLPTRPERDADVLAASAAPAGPAPPLPQGTERRAQLRFPGTRKAACRFLGQEADALAAACIDNVSRSGVALRMRQRAPRGAVLVITMDGIGGRFARPMLARVTNCRAAADGLWRIGCSFVRPLTDDEVQVLVVPDGNRAARAEFVERTPRLP
jgi:hypothetical protein